MKGRVLDAVMAAGRESRSLALATDLATGRQLLVDDDAAEGELVLDAAGLAEVRQALRSDRNMTLATSEGRIFVEVFSPPRRCFVVGAVHIAQPLVRMLKLADYAVTVIDPREEYAAGWDLAGVPLDRGMPDDVVRELNLDGHSAIVALTHDPKLDDLALMEALKSAAFYVGAIGSKKNNDARRERLREFDLSADEIARLRGPVGLYIGSKTPPEIAVAILAEMTAVRRGVQIPETIEPPKVNVTAGCEVPQN